MTDLMCERSEAGSVLELIEPLAGFEDHRSFALVRLDEEGTICALRATDGSDLSFLVVPPCVFFPDYTPRIDDSVLEVLDVRDRRDILILVVVRTGPTLACTSANLLAPVVVNCRTRRAAQIVVDDSWLQLRAPLAAA